MGKAQPMSLKAMEGAKGDAERLKGVWRTIKLTMYAAFGEDFWSGGDVYLVRWAPVQNCGYFDGSFGSPFRSHCSPCSLKRGLVERGGCVHKWWTIVPASCVRFVDIFDDILFNALLKD